MKQEKSFAEIALAAKNNTNGAGLELIRKQSALTVADAVQGVQLSKLKREQPDVAEDLVVMLVENLQASLNVTNTLNGLQIAQVALDILESWKFLKLEELAYVFKNARLGKYGKSFNRLDSAVIGEWIDAYDHSEEKAAFLEKQAANFKQQEKEPFEPQPEMVKWIERMQENIKNLPGPQTNRRAVVNPMVQTYANMKNEELEAICEVYANLEGAGLSVRLAQEELERRKKDAA